MTSTHKLSGGSALASIFAAALFASAAPATAQTESTTPASPESDEADIVVTASKFGTGLNKAPVSATEIDSAALVKEHIVDLSGIAKRVPSLVYTTPTNNAQAFIRGIGSNFAQIGLESSVATYIDGVYLESQNGAAVSTLDLANVQVLKGPQGTLYGRNATGGAIVATTNDPTHRFEGSAAAQYGRFDNFMGELVLNAPISDTLAFRVAGRYTNQPGWRDMPAGQGGKVGASRNFTTRGKLGWTPTSDLKVIAGVEYSKLSSNTYFAHERLTAPLCLACGIYGLTPSTDFYDATQNAEPRSTVRYLQATLQILYDTDQFSLTSVSGYRHQRAKFFNEQDHTEAAFLDAYVFATTDTYTNDTYVKTKFGGPFNFMVGFSWIHDKGSQWSYLFGDQFGPLVGVVNNNYTKLESLSGYVEGYLNITDQVKLTGGVRYTRDTKSIVSVADDNAAIAFGQDGFTGKKKFPQTTPRVVLSYDGDAGYYYASFNRGVKSGGWSTPTFSTASVTPVNSENLESFEIGAKHSFFNGALRTTIAAFTGKYNNIQVQHIDATSGGPVFQNAASGRVKGVEFDIVGRPTEQLNIGAGVTYLGSHFLDFPDAAVTVVAPGGTGLVSGIEDLSGTRLPRSPRWSGYLTVDYTQPLANGWSALASVSGRYTSSFDFLAGGGGPLRLDAQKAYTKIDADLSATDPGGNFTVGVFVQNLTKRKYFDYASTSVYGAFYTPALPRMYGIRVGQKF